MNHAGAAGEGLSVQSAATVRIATRQETIEILRACGRFHAQCFDAKGRLKWEDDFPNTITDQGAKHWQDNYFQASSFSQTGPYMGLISSVSWSAVAVGDTAAQINGSNGWKEAGAGSNTPLYASSGARIAMSSWNAATGTGANNRIKATNTAPSFTMSGAGTLKGCFVILGSGAVTTNASTAGTLFSAGTFSGGDKTVANLDVVNVSWQVAM